MIAEERGWWRAVLLGLVVLSLGVSQVCLGAAAPSVVIEVSEASPIEGDVVRVGLLLSDADPRDVLVPGLSINGQPVAAGELAELGFREFGLLLHLDQPGPWQLEATVTDGAASATASVIPCRSR